jgi:hypothetical protein
MRRLMGGDVAGLTTTAQAPLQHTGGEGLARGLYSMQILDCEQDIA